MTQRTEGGLRTIPALRLLYACTKTMLHYGIKFWGHKEKQAKAMDAYMYEALRRLFDISKATPHRAISSEHSLPPTKTQWEYIKRKFGERRRRRDPLEGIEWRAMKEEDREARSSLPWRIKSERKSEKLKKGETEEWEKIKAIGQGEIAIFTDGSVKDGKVGYGIAAYTKDTLAEGRTCWEEAGTMKEKGILDANTWTIIRVLQVTKQGEVRARIFTDSRNARDWILGPRKEGPTAYMWEELCEATIQRKQEAEISWVKGHAGNKGNERADAFARKRGDIRDLWKGKSHAASAHEISTARNMA